MHNASRLGEGGPIVFHSPGAGPVDEATSPEAAARNVAAFLTDLGERETRYEPIIEPEAGIEDNLLMGGTRYGKEHDGRYPFRVFVDGVRHVVEMPGVSLEGVRYTGENGQNPWDFPRVFVNGSSRLWMYGLVDVGGPDATSPFPVDSAVQS